VRISVTLKEAVAGRSK